MSDPNYNNLSLVVYPIVEMDIVECDTVENLHNLEALLPTGRNLI